jgi:uracil-DNA glycosylase
VEPRSAEERRKELVELFREVSHCRRCPLFRTRTRAVFGAGNADADLMFVGEAPGNRDPQPDEIDACKPYLHRQIELIEPKVICTLGNFATKLLTRSQRGITGVHGRPQVHELGARTVRVYPLYHPAAALRSTRTLDELREDFSRLPALLAEPAPVPIGAVAPIAAVPAPEPPQIELFG